jgi:PncC family amidohydrolase
MDINDVVKITEKINGIFANKGLTLSVAESCTGGLISHWVTSTPGASAYFRTGVVAYSREAKENILTVPGETINTFGMVSRETAVEMAEKVRMLAKADYSVSTTGNLGPDVLEGKERGLIYVGASSKGKTITKRLVLKGSRTENKESAAQAALELLVELVEEET